MINTIGKYIFHFIVIILIQVLILNNLNLSGYINPFLYVIVLLTLPVEMPGWLLLLAGMVTGLIIDAFLNTIGVHASAGVFLAFLRPYFLRYLAPREGYEPGSLPTPSHFGFVWFFKYVLLAVFAHHLFLFLIEVFTFDAILRTIWKTIVSTIFTVGFIMIAQLFSGSKKKAF